METKITTTGSSVPTATVGDDAETKLPSEKKEATGKVFSFAALELVNKMLAPLASLGIKVPCVESLDSQGYIKDPDAKKSAAVETEKKITAYLAKPGVKKGDAAHYLQTETKFPLLPPKEQSDFLKAHDLAEVAPQLKQNWTVNQRFAHAFKLEAGSRLGSDMKGACRLYEMALQWDPESGPLHYHAAWASNFAASETQDPKEALQGYNAALRHLLLATAKDPKDFQAWRMAAQILVKAGRPDDAVGVFSTALRVGAEIGATSDDIKSLQAEKTLAEEKAQPIWNRESGARPAMISESLILVGAHLPALSLEEQTKFLTGTDVTQAGFVKENPAADQLAGLMKKKGVQPGEVKPFKDSKEVTGQDYLNYAFENYPKYRNEIETCFGKLPFNSEQQPDPKFVTSLFDAKSPEVKKILTRHQQLKEKVEGLKKDVLERTSGGASYDAALQDAEKIHPEFKLLEMYGDLIASPKGNLQQKAGLYLAIKGEEAKAKAKEARLTLFNPADAKPVVAAYQEAGNYYDQAFALGRDVKDAKLAAEYFYNAAAFAPKGESKGLYLQGVASLQKIRLLPSDSSASALEKDPDALKLMGLGLQSAGKYREAIQAYDLAFLAGDKSPALFEQVEVNKKHLATYEKLGAGFDGRLKDLEAKEKSGKLASEEVQELKTMRAGLDLLERCNHLSFPGTKAPAESAFVAKVRDQVVTSLKLPLDAKLVKAAEDSVKRLEKAEGSLKKMELERDKVAQQVFKDAPYVLAYLEKTKDYSWLRLDYSGLKPGDEWNAEILNNQPALEAYREMAKKDPAMAKQIEDAFKVFQEPKLLSGLDNIASLEALEQGVEAAELKIFKTDEKGKIPEETNPLTGEKTKRYETHPAFQKWAIAAEQVELEKNPVSFIRNGLGKNQQSLQAMTKVMPELEKSAQDLKSTEAKLAAAQKAGDTAEVQKQEAKLADIRKNLGALKTFLGAQAEDFLKDYATYQKHAAKLGVLEKDGSVPFGNEMAAAKLNIEKLKNALSDLDPEKDPGKALGLVQTYFKVLGGSQKTLFKSMSFADAALAKGWRSTNPDAAMAGMTSANMLDANPTPGVDPMWAAKNEILETQWNLEKSNLNKQLGEKELSNAEIQADRDKQGGFALLAEVGGIDKGLRVLDAYLRANDQQMFKNLKTTLTEGIEFEIEKWSQARSQMKERGDDTKEIDKLIAKYFDAKFALRDGDMKKSLALYREALDSKRSNVAFKQYEESNKNQMYRTMVLEVAIITAATLLTAGTMSLAAGASVTVVEAGAAMEIGAATMGQQALMLGLESVAFVGWDKAIHYGLHKGTGAVEDPFKGARDAKGNLQFDLLAADLTFDVVKNMGLFKTLRSAGEFYQALAVGRKILANPATRGLVEEAAKISSTHGKVIFKQLMEIEMAKMGMLGKAAFKTGAFATEAGAMQTWNNIALLLEVPWQNAVHGKKLEFSTELKNVNSVESMEHGLLQLIGLKLGGFGAHPLQAKMASGKTQQAALSFKIKHFGELRESLAKGFAAPGASFDAKTKQQITEFLKLGDHIYTSAGKELPGEALEEWKEVRTSLDAILKVEGQLKQLVDNTKGKMTEEKRTGLEAGFKAGQVVVPSQGKLGSAEFHLISKEPVPGDPAFEKVTVSGTTFYRKPTDKASYEAYQVWQKRTTPPPLPKAALKPTGAKAEAKQPAEGASFDAAALAGGTKIKPMAPKAPADSLTPKEIEVRKKVFLGSLGLAAKLGFEQINTLYSPHLAEAFKKFAERLVKDPHPGKTLQEMEAMGEAMLKNLEGMDPAQAKSIKATLLSQMLRGEVKTKQEVLKTLETLKKGAGSSAAAKPEPVSKAAETSGVKVQGNFKAGGERTGEIKGAEASGTKTKAAESPGPLPGAWVQTFVTPESLRSKGGLTAWSAAEVSGKSIYERAALVWGENVAKSGDAPTAVDRWADLAKLAAGGDPQAKAALKTLEDIHQGATFLHTMSEAGVLGADVVRTVSQKLETDLARLEFYKKNLSAVFENAEPPRLKTADLIRSKNLSEIEKARQTLHEIDIKKKLGEPLGDQEKNLYKESKTLVDNYVTEFVQTKEFVKDFEAMELEKKAEGKESEISSEERLKYEQGKIWLKNYQVLQKVWSILSHSKDPIALQTAKDVISVIEHLQDLNVAIPKIEGEIPKLTGEKKSAAEKELKALQGLRARNLQLLEKWEKVAGEYNNYQTAFTKISEPFDRDEVRLNSKETNLKLIRGDIQQKYHGDAKAYYEAFAKRTGQAKDFFLLYGNNVEKFVEAEILPARECPVEILSVEGTPLHEYPGFYEAGFMKGFYGEPDRLPLEMRIRVKAGDRPAMMDYLKMKYSDPKNNARVLESKEGVLVLEFLKPAGQKIKISVEVPGEAKIASTEAKTVPPPKMEAAPDSGPLTVKPGKISPSAASGPESAPPTVKPGKAKSDMALEAKPSAASVAAEAEKLPPGLRGIVKETAKPQEYPEFGIFHTPDPGEIHALIESIHELGADRLEGLLKAAVGMDAVSPSHPAAMALSLLLNKATNPNDKAMAAKTMKFLKTASGRELGLVLKSDLKLVELAFQPQHLEVLASEDPHQALLDIAKISNPKVRDFLMSELVLKEFRIAKELPPGSEPSKAALELLHLFGIEPKEHPKFPWTDGDLKQRAELFFQVKEKKTEMLSLFQKAFPGKEKEVESFLNEVWEVIRVQDVQDTILPYTPHGWGHSMEVLKISDDILMSSPSIQKELVKSLGSVEKARALVQFIGLFHDAGYGCLQPHESKGVHAERSGELFQEKFREKISKLFGIQDPHFLDEVYLAIDRHGADKPHEHNYMEASEKDHPLLMVVRLADNLDLTADRMRDIQMHPLMMKVLKDMYDLGLKPEFKAADKPTKTAMLDSIRDRYLKAGGIFDKGMSAEDAALGKALLLRLNETTWPHFKGCEMVLNHNTQEVVDPTTGKTKMVVRIEIKGQAKAGEVYEYDKKSQEVRSIDAALYQVYRAYVAAKSLSFRDEPLEIRYLESDKAMLPGTDIVIDLGVLEGNAPVSKIFKLPPAMAANDAKGYDAAAGIGGKAVDSKGPTLLNQESGEFAVSFSQSQAPVKIVLAGRPLIFRRSKEGGYEVAAFAEVGLVSVHGGEAKKISASKLGGEMKWTKIEVGDRVGEEKKVFKGAANS